MDPLPWFAPPPAADTASVVIVGAGLAGCHLAVALTNLAIPVTLIDASPKVASEASGNTRCVLRPHVVRTTGLLNQFNESAFTHTRKNLAALESAGESVDGGFPGVLQLLRQAGDWPTLRTARNVNATQASELAGIPLDTPALHFPDAGWINAESYCRALIATVTAKPSFTLLLNTRVSVVEPDNDSRRSGGSWKLHVTGTNDSNARVLQASTVVLCCGAGANRMAQLKGLPLQLSSGQTTRCAWPFETAMPKTVLCGKRYLIPADPEITVGATHWRDNEQTATDPQDDALNMTALAELIPDLHSRSARALPEKLVASAQWRSLRASTPDRLPLVGGVPDQDFYRQAYANLQHGPRHQEWPRARYLNGLYVLAGLGSRGAGTASLCAELLARQIANCTDDQLPDDSLPFSELLHPARFLIRQLKRPPAVAADGILGGGNT